MGHWGRWGQGSSPRLGGMKEGFLGEGRPCWWQEGLSR